MLARLTEKLNELADVVAKHVPGLDILEIILNDVSYVASFNPLPNAAAIADISGGRPIAIHPRNPANEYDRNLIIFADNNELIATLYDKGEILTSSGRTFNIFDQAGPGQVIAIYNNHTVLDVSAAKCAHTLIYAPGDYDAYEYYYDANYQLIQPKPTEYNGYFVSLNPERFLVIGEYTIFRHGAVRKRLIGVNDAGLMKLTDGAVNYMLIGIDNGTGIFDGHNYTGLRHLSALLTRGNRLKGVNFEHHDYDGLENDTVYNVGNNRYVACIDGEYVEVYRKGQAAIDLIAR